MFRYVMVKMTVKLALNHYFTEVSQVNKYQLACL